MARLASETARPKRVVFFISAPISSYCCYCFWIEPRWLSSDPQPCFVPAAVRLLTARVFAMAAVKAGYQYHPERRGAGTQTYRNRAFFHFSSLHSARDQPSDGAVTPGRPIAGRHTQALTRLRIEQQYLVRLELKRQARTGIRCGIRRQAAAHLCLL